MEKASFGTQANALLRKNLAFQKRNRKSNCVVVVFPVVICALLVLIQKTIDAEFQKPKYRCGCACVEKREDGTCRTEECGLQHSTSLDQVGQCAIPSPPTWPPILQVPRPQFRAADEEANLGANGGLPNRQCRRDGSCPTTVLLTGGSRSFAIDVASKFFNVLPDSTSANTSAVLSTATLGSGTNTRTQNFLEPAFLSDSPLYTVQPECPSNSSYSARVNISENLPESSLDIECVSALSLWRNTASEINGELYKGYRQSNLEGRIDEIMAAYDFMDSDNAKFDGRIWYNSTYKNETLFGAIAQARVVSSVNVMSNSYIKHVKGGDFDMKLEFTKEMPKPGTILEFDASSLLGPLFFLWIIELVFPIMLSYLVYEKQYKLRIMMKMHGLGDGPYWIISYLYFLFISTIHVLLLVLFGSLIGLNFFTSQDYSLQFVFYFAFVNLQITLAFLAAPLFNRVISAQAIAYVYLFGTGLLAGFLLQSFIQDLTFSESWIRVMELLPAFALYRGLYEFGEYASNGKHMDSDGMRWKDLDDDRNGMKEVLIIMILEWLIFLPLSYYVDQLSSKGRRKWKNPLSSLPSFKKNISSFRRLSFRRQVSKVFIEVDKPDVAQERELVEQLRLERSTNYPIVSDNLKKVYPGKDGNPDKLAVQGLSLALAPGECFGMLGPNGAGKTTFISMMTGLITPSSGDAYVEGHSINTEMDKIYTSMGVCPQHDMLWETLTAREHLLFYGRLKNLKGSALTNAVEESLKSVGLFHGGIGDKQAMKYSGGMKRRLSVAISLIGNPKVVYMDEPSTGLDPASRNNLWKAIKKAKKNCAIILTTHSMEEAEVLCDRLGIFVGGALQCIGNPKQLKARYGDTYVFTITTRTEEEQEVENLVCGLSSNATKIYHISGTQKFEIPKQDVEIADVFRAVEEAKRRLPIQAWGLANTTLEDVFIKVAKGASSNYELS